jgi:selenide,water dikinase
MIPGYLAGVYNYDEIHIDLFRLTTFADVRFVVDEVIGLDLKQRKIFLKSTGSLDFDLISINIGTTPYSLREASERFTPIKPIHRFLKVFDQIMARQDLHSIAVVGAGASGVELALNLSARLPSAKITLIHASAKILETFPDSVSKILLGELISRRIELKLETVILEEQNGTLIADGWRAEFDHIFWTTSPKAPDWIGASGLAVDDRGFIEINSSMQSINHTDVFAAGDVSSLKEYRLAKSGVYAVRAAKYLFFNMRAWIQNRPLKQWMPNLSPLALIGLNGKSAVLSKGNFGFRAKVLWKLKDSIDRRFMAQFENLPSMSSQVPCGGCAAKVSPTALASLLKKEIRLGISSEDAALLEFENFNIISSMDRITSLVSDPFVFGKIAVMHAVSDIYASGGKPKYMQVAVELPRSTTDLHFRDLPRLMEGMAEGAKDLGTEIKGGHSGLGQEFAVTVSVTGTLGRTSSKKRFGRPDDVLILTKPLGTGILFAGLMQQKSKGPWIQSAIDSMLKSNKDFAQIFEDLGVVSQTDVTGFGLLGHLLEVLKGQLSAELHYSKIPRFAGVDELISAGVRSTAYEQNSIFLDHLHGSHLPDGIPYLLCDPQTSGGLLVSLPHNLLDELWHQVDRLGLVRPWVIGRLVELRDKPIYLYP